MSQKDGVSPTNPGISPRDERDFGAAGGQGRRTPANPVSEPLAAPRRLATGHSATCEGSSPLPKSLAPQAARELYSLAALDCCLSTLSSDHARGPRPEPSPIVNVLLELQGKSRATPMAQVS
jgi:hypothetical protein